MSSGVLLTVFASIYHDGPRDTGVIVKGYSTGPDTASTIGCTLLMSKDREPEDFIIHGLVNGSECYRLAFLDHLFERRAPETGHH